MWAALGAALLQWASMVILALCGSGVAAVFKQASLADACFRLALLAGGPLTLLLHLTSPYYSLAPSWLEPAFHRWRVSRYFRVGCGPHSQSRKVEQERSARPYHDLALPPCGCIVRWEYRTNHKCTEPKTSGMKLRAVSWNLEFGYLLSPIIARRSGQVDVLLHAQYTQHPSRPGPLGTAPHLVYLSIPRWEGLALGSRVLSTFVRQRPSTQAGCLRVATHTVIGQFVVVRRY